MEFKEEWEKLIIAIAESLKLDKFCEWLNKVLRR